jgi:hypothetical protein
MIAAVFMAAVFVCVDRPLLAGKRPLEYFRVNNLLKGR